MNLEDTKKHGFVREMIGLADFETAAAICK